MRLLKVSTELLKLQIMKEIADKGGEIMIRDLLTNFPEKKDKVLSIILEMLKDNSLKGVNGPITGNIGELKIRLNEKYLPDDILSSPSKEKEIIEKKAIKSIRLLAFWHLL